MLGYGKLESSEEEGPAGMTWIQSFSSRVISENCKWIGSPFQPVLPFFQCQSDSQNFPVINIVLFFCGGKFLGIEGYWMQLEFFTKTLR